MRRIVNLGKVLTTQRNGIASQANLPAS